MPPKEQNLNALQQIDMFNSSEAILNVNVVESYIGFGLVLLFIFSLIVLRTLISSKIGKSNLVIFDTNTASKNKILLVFMQKTNANNINSAIKLGLMMSRPKESV